MMLCRVASSKPAMAEGTDAVQPCMFIGVPAGEDAAELRGPPEARESGSTPPRPVPGPMLSVSEVRFPRPATMPPTRAAASASTRSCEAVRWLLMPPLLMCGAEPRRGSAGATTARRPPTDEDAEDPGAGGAPETGDAACPSGAPSDATMGEGPLEALMADTRLDRGRMMLALSCCGAPRCVGDVGASSGLLRVRHGLAPPWPCPKDERRSRAGTKPAAEAADSPLTTPLDAEGSERDGVTAPGGAIKRLSDDASTALEGAGDVVAFSSAQLSVDARFVGESGRGPPEEKGCRRCDGMPVWSCSGGRASPPPPLPPLEGPSSTGESPTTTGSAPDAAMAA